MGKSREAEHQAFLDWLLKFIKEHRIDALIVAGDIFDTGTPPSYARQMFNRFVGDSKDAECQLVLLGGNHDSVAMLCLLYTSPSPRDKRQSRMPSSA